MWEKLMGNTLKWNWFKGEEPLQAKPILRRKKIRRLELSKTISHPKNKKLEWARKTENSPPNYFSLVHYLWYIWSKGWHLAEIGLSNVISDSLSLIRTTVHIILICFPTNISILHWLTEENCDIVQNSTCTNDDAHFFWSHTNFRMENMKATFPAAKSLFNDYPCFTMSIIISNLSWGAWVDIRGHHKWAQCIPTVPEENSIIQWVMIFLYVAT